jgi:hypothetical protein
VSAEIVPLTIPRGLATISAAAPVLFVPHAKAAERFFEFFTANISNSAGGVVRTGKNTGDKIAGATKSL